MNTIASPDFLGADWTDCGLSDDLLLLAVVLEPQVGPEDLDRLEALAALAAVEALLGVDHRLRVELLPVLGQVRGVLLAQFARLDLCVDLVHVTRQQGPDLKRFPAILTRIVSSLLGGRNIVTRCLLG